MMVHGQNGAHLSEFLLRNELEGYTQGKGRGLAMAHDPRQGFYRGPFRFEAARRYAEPRARGVSSNYFDKLAMWIRQEVHILAA